MPVFEQGYQPYAGPRSPLKARWIPLWRDEVVPYVQKRAFILLLILALMPWLILGAGLSFAKTQFGDSAVFQEIVKALPAMDEAWVAKLLTNGWSNFLLVIVCVWVGSGLVARDRKERTLEVFLGRALGPAQYLWAKGAALGAYLLLFTFLPTVILVIFHVGLTGDVPFLWQHARILWGTLLYTAVGPGSIVLAVLALSSLSRSPRVVGLALVGAAFFGPAAAGILYAITKSPASWTVAALLELRALGYHCLGADPDMSISAPHAVLYFVALAAASLLVLWLRFKDREVLR